MVSLTQQLLSSRQNEMTLASLTNLRVQMELANPLEEKIHLNIRLNSDREGAACHPTSLEEAATEMSDTESVQTWPEVLQQVKQRKDASKEWLVGLLETAISLVSQDSKWQSSGVSQLLQKGLKFAKAGACPAARQQAISALDFVTVSEKIKIAQRAEPLNRQGSGPQTTDAGPVKQPASGGVCSSSNNMTNNNNAAAVAPCTSTSSDETSTDIPRANLVAPTTNSGTHAEPGTAQHAAAVKTDSMEDHIGAVAGTGTTTCTLSSESAAAAPCSSNAGTTVSEQQRSGGHNTDEGSNKRNSDSAFPVPQLPHKRRKSSHHGPSRLQQQSSIQHDMPESVDANGAAVCDWSGVYGLVSEEGTRVSDLCHVTLQLPKHIATAMPKTVQFTHLVQRRGVTLGKYQAVRTIVRKANMRQTSRLRSMAQHELVAVVAIPTVMAHLIMVPYTDNRSQLRLVSFMLPADANTDA